MSEQHLATTAQPNLAVSSAEGSDQDIQLRNAWLIERLDPEHNLPAVVLACVGEHPVHDNQRSDPFGYRQIMNAQGRIGDVTVMPAPGIRAGDYAYVTSIQIDSAERGKGQGKAAYLEVLKFLPAGIGLQSSLALSKDSGRIWRWLEEKGVAEHNSERDNEFRTVAEFSKTTGDIDPQIQAERTQKAGRIVRKLRRLTKGRIT